MCYDVKDLCEISTNETSTQEIERSDYDLYIALLTRFGFSPSPDHYHPVELPEDNYKSVINSEGYKSVYLGCGAGYGGNYSWMEFAPDGSFFSHGSE